MLQVVKRNGEIVKFNIKKIQNAISKAFLSQNIEVDNDVLQLLSLRVTSRFDKEEIIDGVRQAPNYDNGYMRSGDIVSVDESGRYYIRGRIKDIIINENGENVYPDEIEDYFKEVKNVEKVCVVGVPTGNNGHEDITCVMEVAEGLDQDQLKAIKDQCEQINLGLANEKKVQKFCISTNKLPLTATMKVKRFQVKKMFETDPSQFGGFEEQRKVIDAERKAVEEMNKEKKENEELVQDSHSGNHLDNFNAGLRILSK